VTIFWLRVKSTIINSWWWTYLAREHREKTLFDFTSKELDEMWEDDVVDIHNFTHMDPGPAKEKMRQILMVRRDWYFLQRLYDWAEQIDVALWTDERNFSAT
jgi:hypothetical protein